MGDRNENNVKKAFTLVDIGHGESRSIDSSGKITYDNSLDFFPVQYPLSEAQISYLAQKKIENDLLVDRQCKIRAFNEECDSKRREALEQARQRRALAHIIVSRDYNGEFVYRIDDGQSSQAFSPVFKGFLDIESTVLDCAEDERRILQICYGRVQHKEKLYLMIDHNVGKKLCSELIKRGIGVVVSRRNKEEVFDQLISMLIDAAQKERLPYHHGWNMTSTGDFKFYGGCDLTFKEVVQYVQ